METGCRKFTCLIVYRGGANESGYPGSGEAVVFVSVDCAEWLLRVPFFCGGMPALQ